MLRSFRLSNHRSFLDEQELLLIPSAPSRDHEVLTVAAIYGANASGKSNLLDGLSFMSRAVRDSFRRWDAEGGVPRRPFRLSSAARLEASTFVVEIVVDKVPYTYGFSVDDSRVTEEWLYSYPEKRKRVLFERDSFSIRFGTTVGQLKSRLELLEELTRGNALFLSVAAQSNLTALVPVHRWFAHGLYFRSPGSVGRHDVSWQVYQYLARNDGVRRKMVELLTAADTGITDVRVEGNPNLFSSVTQHLAARIDKLYGRVPSAEPVELFFVHGDAEEQLRVDEESDGTRNWLDLLPLVLDALEHGCTLVLDEIDASLHPLLVVRLLQLFTSVETNPRQAQLIFTTHDTTPLGTYAGREVLQRDQVWFVEKDTDGRSKLYPLSDFKPRIGENAEKRYLGGSYGAVPVLSDLEFER